MTHVAGIGVDVVAIDLVRRHTGANPAFAEAAFTDNERTDCAGRPDRLAARWAAKEAVMKALGTGLGTVDPHDVEIVRANGGQPQVVLRRAAEAAAVTAGVDRVHVSVSHDGPHAIAFAIAERRTP